MIAKKPTTPHSFRARQHAATCWKCQTPFQSCSYGFGLLQLGLREENVFQKTLRKSDAFGNRHDTD